jgi:hypothetical protein
LEYIAEPVVIAKGAANHVKVSPLYVSQGLKAPVVNKFSDVIFSDELSIMPSDRDIEFVIEWYLELLRCIRDPIGWLLSN